MSTVRLRRLQADFQKLSDYARRHPRLRLISFEGQPPELYQLEYQIVGLRQIDDQLQVVKSHIVEIRLPRDYPRTPPQCRMLTPIFHPNIAPHAICIGDHWSAGEPLWSMVARIGEMIAYQSYNTKSPLNGEAARWVEQNLARLPLDRVSMQLDESAAKPAPVQAAARPVSRPSPQPAAPAAKASPPKSQAPASAPSAPPAGKITMVCPGCGHRYQVSAEHIGKRARCSHCQKVIVVSPPAEKP
jgi:ubiquitin-protein ligase